MRVVVAGMLTLGLLVSPAASAPSAALDDAIAFAAHAAGVAVPEVAAPVVPAEGLGVALSAWHAHVLGAVPSADRIGRAVRAFAPLPASTRSAVATLASAMAAAQAMRARALSTVTPREIAFAERVALGGPASPAETAAALAIVRRIDTGAMLRAAALVAGAARAAAPLVAGAEAPVCDLSICVGGDGDDVYREDVQLLIEPAGDDVYLNNAGGHLSTPMLATTGGCVAGGGTTGKARPNLDCTPAPGNACTYDVANNATGRDDLPVAGLPHHDPPGSGSLNEGSCGSDERRARLLAGTADAGADHDSRGVAVLLDLGGSDTYTVPWSHDDPLFGLIDACYPGETDRVNTNRDLFQGGALAGISLLWDRGEGNDAYRGRLNAQGSGHVGGVGMLVTDGSGDDLFWADRLSQGNGIAGGVGLLVNTKAGDHTYLLDAPLVYRNEFAPGGRGCAQEGRAGQGQGGFGGVGVLWSDHAGRTTYRAVTQVTRNTHPFEPVLDASGRPVLAGGTDAQGSGESFPIADTPGGIVAGVGLLFDRTDSDARVCPGTGGGAGAGMTQGSRTGAGTDLSSAGTPDACGTFNLPPELSASDLRGALEHLAAGAVGIRVVA